MTSEIDETIEKTTPKNSTNYIKKLNDQIKKDWGKLNQQNVNNPMRNINQRSFEISPSRMCLNTHNTSAVLQQAEGNKEEGTDSDESEIQNDASKSEQDKSFAEIVKKLRRKRKKWK